MKLEASDIPELRPIIAEAVRCAIEQLDRDGAKLADRLGYTEPEAAALLGVAAHVLRDCRLRGEIHARKVGSRYVYSRTALMQFLAERA